MIRTSFCLFRGSSAHALLTDRARRVCRAEVRRRRAKSDRIQVNPTKYRDREFFPRSASKIAFAQMRTFLTGTIHQPPCAQFHLILYAHLDSPWKWIAAESLKCHVSKVSIA